MNWSEGLDVNSYRPQNNLRRLEQIVTRVAGGFKNKRVLEIGCGGAIDGIDSKQAYYPKLVEQLHKKGVQIVGVDAQLPDNCIFEGYRMPADKLLEKFAEAQFHIVYTVLFWSSPKRFELVGKNPRDLNGIASKLEQDLLMQIFAVLKPVGFYINLQDDTFRGDSESEAHFLADAIQRFPFLKHLNADGCDLILQKPRGNNSKA